MGRKTKFQERRHTESHNRHSHPRDSHRRESHLRDSHRRDRELKLYILSLLLVVRIRQGRAGKIELSKIEFHLRKQGGSSVLQRTKYCTVQ